MSHLKAGKRMLKVAHAERPHAYAAGVQDGSEAPERGERDDKMLVSVQVAGGVDQPVGTEIAAQGEEGNGWPDGDGGVTVVETVGKDNAGDRLRIAVRARDVLPATGAVPLTPRCHRS